MKQSTGSMRLTIAFSTIGQRIAGLHMPPQTDGVGFLVVWQRASGQAMQCAHRSDVRVVKPPGEGISNSRNAILSYADTDFLLFADDDMRLDIGGVLRLKHALMRSPQLSFARGWRAGQANMSRRSCRLNHFNTGRVCAPELMIRVADFRKTEVRFNPSFGLGAPYGLGEEYVFLSDALKAGLKGCALPIVTGAHDGASTGDNWDDPQVLMARRAVLDHVFGPWAVCARAAYASKHMHRFPSIKTALRFVFGRQNTSMTSSSPLSEERFESVN